MEEPSASARSPLRPRLPYRGAEVYVLLQIALTFVAFWPGYFTRLPTSPLGFHLHAATASAWMLLLAAQIWSAHRRKRSLHRSLGRASLLLFPLLLGGMAAVIISLARATIAGDPLYIVYGEKIEVVSAIAFGSLAAFYVAALRTRRLFQTHARYMIATTLMLCFSITDRLDGKLPIALLQGLSGFSWCVRLANGVTLALALSLFLQDRSRGRPYLAAAAVAVIQMVAWEVVGTPSTTWGLVHLGAAAPLIPSLMVAMVAGSGLCLLGWAYPTRSRAFAT